MKIKELHIENFYLGNDLDIDFDVSNELLSSDESKFTLIVGENGVRKTSLLKEIYGLFRQISYTSPSYAKINKNGDDIYITNKNPKTDINIVLDSFALLDKLSKNNLNSFNNRYVSSYRGMINVGVTNDFINNIVYSSLSDVEKFNNILEVFKFLKIDPKSLVLTWANSAIGRKSSNFYLEKIMNSNSLIKRLDGIMDYILKNEMLRLEWYGFKKEYNDENRLGRLYITDLRLVKTKNLSIKMVDYIGKLRFVENSINYLLKHYYRTNLTFRYKGRPAILFTDLKEFINREGIFYEIFTFSKDYLDRNFFTKMYIDKAIANNRNNTDSESYELVDLSSGELGTLLRFTKLVTEIERNSIVLIDEPELHLHPSWMISYIYRLKKLFKNYNCHFIIATHSPLLVSNLNSDDIVILKKTQKALKVEKVEVGTFGVEIDEILSQVFGVRLIDSVLIRKTFDSIERLLNSGNKEKQISGLQSIKLLPDSARKIDLFMKYYDLLMELNDES